MWSTLDTTSLVHSVGVAYVHGETILALAEEVVLSYAIIFGMTFFFLNEILKCVRTYFILFHFQVNIAFYRPTETALQLVNVHKISTPVQSASLHTHDDSLFLLVLSESQGNLIPYFMELNLIFQPAAVSHTNLPRDPLLQCLTDVENNLRLRDSQLTEIGKLQTHLVRKSVRGRFKGKLVVKKVCCPLSRKC